MKISEKKALETYPKDKLTAVEAVNRTKRFGYIQGYNQAMQDVLEKACGYLAGIALTHPFLLDLDRFTKYMQDE